MIPRAFRRTKDEIVAGSYIRNTYAGSNILEVVDVTNGLYTLRSCGRTFHNNWIPAKLLRITYAGAGAAMRSSERSAATVFTMSKRQKQMVKRGHVVLPQEYDGWGYEHVIRGTKPLYGWAP